MLIQLHQLHILVIMYTSYWNHSFVIKSNFSGSNAESEQGAVAYYKREHIWLKNLV